MVFVIWWFIPFTSLLINLLIIYFMPKHISKKEIYISWFVVALINLSSDIVLSLYFKFYELNGGGIQLSVHFLELTLGASYGIIFLNFMPENRMKFYVYTIVWVVYSLLFELLMVKVNFIHYAGWNIWYSAPFYFIYCWFLRWHLRFIRSG